MDCVSVSVRYLVIACLCCMGVAHEYRTQLVPVSCENKSGMGVCNSTWIYNSSFDEVRFVPDLRPIFRSDSADNQIDLTWGTSVNLTSTTSISGVLKMSERFFQLHPGRSKRITDTVLCDCTKIDMFKNESIYVIATVDASDAVSGVTSVNFSFFVRPFEVSQASKNIVALRHMPLPGVAIYDLNSSSASTILANFKLDRSYCKGQQCSIIDAFMWTRNFAKGERDYCRSLFEMEAYREKEIVQSKDPPPFKLSFTQRAVLPVSFVSHPRPFTGGHQRWYVLVVRNDDITGPGVSQDDITSSVEEVQRRLGRVVAVAILCALLVPIVVLLMILALIYAGPCGWRGPEEDCWSHGIRTLFSLEFWRFAWQQCGGGIRNGGYAGSVVVTTVAYLITGFQLSFGYWVSSQKSGNRDICRYNFGCYTPALVDMPFNSLLSHGAYFNCGISVLLRVLVADFNLQKPTGNHSRPDLCIFYCLGVTIILEGCGSLMYHMCPCEMNFQFDTATMFVIAVLSGIVLLDADENIDTKRVIPPIGLVFLVVVPMWTLNAINAGYDTYMAEVFTTESEGLASVAYSLPVVVWCIIVWLYVGRVFPRHLHVDESSEVRAESFADRIRREVSRFRRCLRFMRNNKALCVLRLFLIAGFIPIVFPVLRFKFGYLNISFLILGLCVISAVMVIGRQLIEHRPSRLVDTIPEIFASTLTLCVGICASLFFLHRTYITFQSRAGEENSGAARSHDVNHSCIFLETFDSHDVWHMLSAAALDLWMHTLLEIRLRIQRFGSRHAHANRGGLPVASLGQDLLHDSEMIAPT